MKIKNILKHALQVINVHADRSTYPYILFGLYGVIAFPAYYFIWAYYYTGYENFILRMVAAALCIPLLLKKYWPEQLKLFLPIYWYGAVLYCFPFLFTFLMLKNHLSHTWVLNTLTVVVQLILILDFLSLTIILPLGLILGFGAYYLTGDSLQLSANYSSIIITYATVIIFGSLFARQREKLQIERAFRARLRGMATIGSGIAHELRTPLLSVQSAVKGVKAFLPKLMNGYRLAQNAGLAIETIRSDHLETLSSVLNKIEQETCFAQTMINMMLINVGRTVINPKEFQPCSIVVCIAEALRRYPFESLDDLQLIHWNKQEDFLFNGEQMLMIHVIFNLLKNSLRSLHAIGKGSIHIWIERQHHYNVLYFKDTGKGIPKGSLKFIFEQFYSDAHCGTGIGLAFCKSIMRSFKGDIACKSVEGEFAEFILRFPIIGTEL